MSIIVQESEDSRARSGGDEETTERRYDIFWRDAEGALQSFDDVQAEAALIVQTPVAIPSTISVEPLFRQSWRITFEDATLAKAVVSYAPEDPSVTPGQPGVDQYSFGVTAETTHINYGYATVKKTKYLNIFDPIDFNGAINVGKDGRPEGVDVVTPRLQWQITRYFPLAQITPAWIKTAANIVGTVNLNTFRTFATGELMLVGLSGAPDFKRKVWEITYTFDCSPNIEGIVFGDLEPVDKRGFDYLWIKYLIQMDDSDPQKELMPRPAQVNVERVYQYRDYSVLGIGS
jgi:hypothetical protein